MVHTGSNKFIGEQLLAGLTDGRMFQSDSKTSLLLHRMIFFGHPGQRSFGTADQDDHREFPTKDGHFAVFDVASACGDEFGNLLDQADLIGPDRCENQVVLLCHRPTILRASEEFEWSSSIINRRA